MLQSYKCCSVYDQSGELLSAKGGRQPVLPSPGWGRWPRSGRMRSSPRPAYATCPPTSLPRAPGPGALGKESDTLFAAKGRAAARVAFPRLGARSARKKAQWTVFSKGRAAARVAFPGVGKVAAKRPDEVVAPSCVRNMSTYKPSTRTGTRSTWKRERYFVCSERAGSKPVLPSPRRGSGALGKEGDALFTAEGGRQPVLPSPRRGSGAPGKEGDALFTAEGGRQPVLPSPCGSLERHEKRAMLCLQQEAGGSPCCLPLRGRWRQSRRMRFSLPGTPTSIAEGTLASLSIQLADAGQADDLIRLLTAFAATSWDTPSANADTP